MVAHISSRTGRVLQTSSGTGEGAGAGEERQAVGGRVRVSGTGKIDCVTALHY